MKSTRLRPTEENGSRHRALRADAGDRAVGVRTAQVQRRNGGAIAVFGKKHGGRWAVRVRTVAVWQSKEALNLRREINPGDPEYRLHVVLELGDQVEVVACWSAEVAHGGGAMSCEWATVCYRGT